MTTQAERDVLLAYAAWWRGKPSQVFRWNDLLDLMPSVQDVFNQRGLVAESLAYDGTDGP